MMDEFIEGYGIYKKTHTLRVVPLKSGNEWRV